MSLAKIPREGKKAPSSCSHCICTNQISPIFKCPFWKSDFISCESNLDSANPSLPRHSSVANKTDIIRDANTSTLFARRPFPLQAAAALLPSSVVMSSWCGAEDHDRDSKQQVVTGERALAHPFTHCTLLYCYFCVHAPCRAHVPKLMRLPWQWFQIGHSSAEATQSDLIGCKWQRKHSNFKRRFDQHISSVQFEQELTWLINYLLLLVYIYRPWLSHFRMHYVQCFSLPTFYVSAFFPIQSTLFSPSKKHATPARFIIFWEKKKSGLFLALAGI